MDKWSLITKNKERPSIKGPEPSTTHDIVTVRFMDSYEFEHY